MATMIPCPASVMGVLGLPQPTRLPCVLAAGHDGQHRYSIEWAPCDVTFPVDGRRCQLGAGHEEAHRSGTVEWGSY